MDDEKTTPIAKWIREQRKKRGQTQAEMATLMGWHQQTVLRYENGHRSPGMGELVALAEWGEVPLMELLAVAGVV